MHLPSPVHLRMGEGGALAPDEGSYFGGASANNMLSHTPFKFVNTSWFQQQCTRQPCSPRNTVRVLSCSISASSPCVTPSTSTINLCSRHAKSAKYLPMLSWRTNLWPPNLRPRKASHKCRSASVLSLRRVRAKVLASAVWLAN